MDSNAIIGLVGLWEQWMKKAEEIENQFASPNYNQTEREMFERCAAQLKNVMTGTLGVDPEAFMIKGEELADK